MDAVQQTAYAEYLRLTDYMRARWPDALRRYPSAADMAIAVFEGRASVRPAPLTGDCTCCGEDSE